MGGAASLAEARYRIFETERFRKDLHALTSVVQARLQKKLTSFAYPLLREEPHLGFWIRKLGGYQPETWRFRVGPWRIFYEIDERQKVVFMTAIDDRKDAYR